VPKRLGFATIAHMPTCVRFDGLRVVIYPNDHPPAHVHVIGGGHEAVFNLNCPEGPPAIRENFGFAKNILGRADAVLSNELNLLCEEWRKLHGNY
jgi:hypothetical protein